MTNTRLTFDSLINKRHKIELGSSCTTAVWSADSLREMLGFVIKHNLFDSDFAYNWTDKKLEYLEVFTNDVLNLLMANIDATLDQYFEYEFTSYSKNEKVLVFSYTYTTPLIDAWFQANKQISEELRDDYYNYRKKYAGVILK